MKITRMVFVTLLFTVAVFNQTSETLRKRLGKPDSVKTEAGKVVSEEFPATPALKVLVNYLPDGSPSYLRVAPSSSPFADVNTDPIVSQETLRGFLDDLIPKGERGKYKGGTFLNIICLPKNDCGGVQEAFEKLTIYYNSGHGGMRYASVSWKSSDSMPKQEK